MDVSAMPDWLIDAQDLRRNFQRERGDGVVAVQDCSFRIAAGETIAIVGPSGSGKTTLLNLIAGLEHPSAGRVTWPAFGPMETLRPTRIGIVFQSPNLLPPLTSLENVALPIRLAGGDNADERAMAALAAFGVEDLADRLPEQLSGGQAERVAVARAIAAEPRLILADEPTGQLDRANGALLIGRLVAWLDRRQSTLVLATHDGGVAARMGRIWHMQHGHLETDPVAA
jgi:putative ABC transport system ATP-binding protein/lipoprotein-releasing system ATP-binding protein